MYKPNWFLNLLWLIPTFFWDKVYRMFGYVFAATVDKGKPISYYFEKYNSLPDEFRGVVPK